MAGSTPVAAVSPADLDRVLERARSTDALGSRIAHAMSVVQGVLDDPEVGETGLALSFNGGKDCTVLLHLFAAVLYARHRSSSGPLSSSSQPPVPPSNPPIASPSQPRELDPSTSSSSTSHSQPSQPSLPSQPSQSPSSSSSTTPSQPPPHAPSTHFIPSQKVPYPPIRSIYITAPNPFPDMDEFVLASADRYGLDLYRFGGGMKAALESYLGCGGGKGVKAVLVGTRRGDPNGNVPELAPTDASWPRFLRVHPILDWSYADVWSFLRDLSVPWCSLYDEGYTSLGSTTNTSPNPLLRDPEHEGAWLPAWRLEDESQERAGRHAPRPTLAS